ncbi:unnamed protein product [Coffea canephora]|uniref:Glycosyltransferase n=1 Tax=Coffea canephora TaxID=49390 RepID=A0A068V5F7_COFCA|nr:unnamed protein product [Coffea canephora]
MKKQQPHILISCLAAQGHLNPSFQLAKSLARAGARVTFATTIYGFSRIKNLPSFSGLSFASFSDGYDDAESRKNFKVDSCFADLTHVGSKNLTKLIQTLSDEDRPVTFLIYGIMMPWAAEVASGMNIPSAFLSFQCAAALAIYHKYFNSQDGVYDGVRKIEPTISVKLPDLPLFENSLEKDSKPCVLVNTFAELEEASIRAIVDHMNVIPIGPLLPCAHSDGNDLSDKSWLDSKPEKSVVYTAFGSLTKLKKDEKLEILRGLEETGRHYMIVMRAVENEDEEVKEMMENGLNGKGKIVPWCSQMEVLCHKSIGCFLTHCGWNSTLESLVAGVPIVGCPHFADQTTNAKLIEEVWSNGVRAKANEDGVVGREEIKRCVDVLMGGGEKEEEIRRNAAKWRGLALEAMKENGSSHNNFKLFLDSLDN